MRDRGHPDDLLSAFLDDELDEAASLQVAHHVARCPTCRAELDGLRRARAALRGLPTVTTPRTLFDAVPDSASHDGRRRHASQAVVGVATGVIALLALAAAIGAGEVGDVVPPVDAVVVDHVVRTGGGPVLQPVVLDR